MNSSCTSATGTETTTIKKTVSTTELGGQADTPDGCVIAQRNTNRQEKWSNRKLTNFSTGKCQVLHQVKNNPMHCYIRKQIFLLLGWPNTGTACPGRLWSLNPWKYSKPGWTWSWATCSSWPCWELGGWIRWSPEVPSRTSHLNYSVIIYQAVSNLLTEIKP